MDKLLTELMDGRKGRLVAFVALGVFLGVQYSDFKTRLTRIEDRLTAIEYGKTKVALK
jgi:hypothetical protein